MNLPEFERRKRTVHEVFSKADKALREDKITQKEHDAFLVHRFESADERQVLADLETKRRALNDEDGGSFSHQSVTLISGFFVVIISLFAILFYSTGGITAAVVSEQLIGETYSENVSLIVPLNGTTRVNLSGEISGLGDVTVVLHLEDEEYLLYEYRYGPPITEHASLEKLWYGEGEIVTFTAVNVSSAYLMTADEAIPLGNTTSIENLSIGEYTIKLIINDSELVQEQLPFSVVPIGIELPVENFNACGDLCRVNLTGNATLHATVRGNVSIILNKLILASLSNHPPEFVTQIDDFEAQDAVHIDLSLVFTDPDGDELFFDSSNHAGNDETIENGVLTITGSPGAYTYVAYASDLEELTSSNMFTVTITESVEPNETMNVTELPAEDNQTNVTLPPIVNETATNVTNITILGCDHPDPNQRPLICLQETERNYFKPEEKFVENKQATAVGKFTPIGNLLIKGEVVEYSTESPSLVDYQLGYADADGDFVPTVWIDTETGNLHLRGRLMEANENIPIQSGITAIANSRGIVLALIDRQAGDMTVRGNVIPYRRSFA